MAKTLVPMWIEGNGNSALQSMASRPVLIEVDTLGTSVGGEMLELRTIGARVMPSESIFFFNSVRITLRFRFLDVVYTLCGMARKSAIDKSVEVEFDFVTREQIARQWALFAKSGLLDDREEDVKSGRDKTDASATSADTKKAQLKKQVDLRMVRMEPPPGGIERRASRRYILGVDAALSIIHSGAVLDCQVLELSLTGCRVFSQQPIQWDLHTWVEIQFVGLGYPLRLAGEIQTKRGAFVCGLRFINLKPRIHERLRDLIGELADKEDGGPEKAGHA